MKKDRFIMLNVFFVLFWGGIIGCEKTPSVEEKPNLPPKIEQIVTTKCAISGCHNSYHPSFNASSWDNIMKGSSIYGSVVIPYMPNWSHFFQHINRFEDLGFVLGDEDRMPPLPYSPLSREEVTEIKDWINDGAKDAHGKYQWAQQEARHNNKLFVLCAGSDLIAVVDIPSNKVMRYISVGVNPSSNESPHYILVSPDKKYIYVTLILGSAVEKYRTDNYEFVGRVTVAGNPSVAAINQAGNRLLVTHWNNDVTSAKLSLVDTENMTILDHVEDDLPFAHGLCVTPDFRTAYVTPNEGNFFAGYRLKADLSGFIEGEKYPLDPSDPVPAGTSLFYPYQVIEVADLGKIFVTCRNSHELRVFDAQTKDYITSVPLDSLPRLMTYDPVSKNLFIICAKSKNVAVQGSQRGSIAVVDAVTNTFFKNIYNVGHRPHGLDVDPVNRRLYVSSENTGGINAPHHPIPGAAYPPGKFSVIDLSTLEAIPSLQTEVAEFPAVLCVSQ